MLRYLKFFFVEYVIFGVFCLLALILQVLKLLLLGDDLLNFIQLFAIVKLVFQVLWLLHRCVIFLLVGLALSRRFLPVVKLNRGGSLFLGHEFTAPFPGWFFFAAGFSRLNHQIGLGPLSVDDVQVIFCHLHHQL